MNNKININPSSTKWLEKDDRVVADYFCDLGFRSLKQILDMRVFDLDSGSRANILATPAIVSGCRIPLGTMRPCRRFCANAV